MSTALDPLWIGRDVVMSDRIIISKDSFIDKFHGVVLVQIVLIAIFYLLFRFQ
jgi:hypothetical protein